MKKLKELERVVEYRFNDGMETSRLPNNEEIVNKINEIVRYINYLEKIKQNIAIKGR